MKPSWTASPISKPQEYINSVAISQDGSAVVAGTFFFPYGAGAKHSSADATQITVGIFAWNANGKSLWQDKFQATEGVYWVALSRDGKWAAAAGLAAPGQGFVYIYNMTSGARVSTYNTKVRVNMVAFSSDGSYLVAGADETYLFSRSGSTWGAPKILPVPSGDSVIAVAVSADGQWIVAGTYLGSVVLVQNTAGVFGAPVSCNSKAQFTGSPCRPMALPLRQQEATQASTASRPPVSEARNSRRGTGLSLVARAAAPSPSAMTVL